MQKNINDGNTENSLELYRIFFLRSNNKSRKFKKFILMLLRQNDHFKDN